MKNRFVKSHGLGNDYIVFDSDNITFPINAKNVKIICDVHYGIGSDGLLLKVRTKTSDFKVKMFNPDGSKFEKSGNGLQIFSKYLYDYGYAKNKSFTIETDGGFVHTEIIKVAEGKIKIIKIDMGKAEFDSNKIPVNINNKECINEPLTINNDDFTNASGSSSCAVAAVLKKLNKIDNNVIINMPGGALDIEVDDNYNLTMTGEAQQIAEGHLSPELVAILNTN